MAYYTLHRSMIPEAEVPLLPVCDKDAVVSMMENIHWRLRTGRVSEVTWDMEDTIRLYAPETVLPGKQAKLSNKTGADLLRLVLRDLAGSMSDETYGDLERAADTLERDA